MLDVYGGVLLAVDGSVSSGTHSVRVLINFLTQRQIYLPHLWNLCEMLIVIGTEYYTNHNNFHGYGITHHSALRRFCIKDSIPGSACCQFPFMAAGHEKGKLYEAMKTLDPKFIRKHSYIYITCHNKCSYPSAMTTWCHRTWPAPNTLTGCDAY